MFLLATSARGLVIENSLLLPAQKWNNGLCLVLKDTCRDRGSHLHFNLASVCCPHFHSKFILLFWLFVEYTSNSTKRIKLKKTRYKSSLCQEFLSISLNNNIILYYIIIYQHNIIDLPVATKVVWHYNCVWTDNDHCLLGILETILVVIL